MKRIATGFVIATAALCAACATSPVLDDYLAGWQSQRDGAIATFAHRNFTFQRGAAERAKVAQSGSLNWADYARPTLAAATRSRAVFIDRGRADVFDRFLAHMRADPAAEATTVWFAAEETKIREQAKKVGDQAGALLAEFAGPIRVGESWGARIVALAADQGTVRGAALALGELRRTAALFYGDVGYDKRTLGFFLPEGAPGGDGRDIGLVREVEAEAGWSAMRDALISARRCEAGGGVTCARTGKTVEPGVLAPDQRSTTLPPGDGSASGPIEGAIMPGDGENRIPSTGPSPIDSLNQQHGW